MSLTMTAGAFAALGVWAWKQNRRDDELENVRIKEEVERLEKLKAEFLNVDEDEDSMDDEDLLASLRERIAEDRDGDEEGENEDEKDDEDKGDTVVAEKETDAEEGAAPDSVDMLKRMWEATDEDPKKDSTP